MSSLLIFPASARERAVADCPGCGVRLELRDLGGEAPNHCFSCGADVLALVLPRAVAAATAGVAAEVAAGGEAGCFFHPEKSAHAPCDACGRFLCALCELEIEGRRLCPTCFESARGSGALASLKTREIQHDRMALTIAGASWLLWPISILTAPLILYLTLRYWRTPRQALLPRHRWRYGAALLLICGPLAIWALFLFPALRYAGRL